MRKAALQLLMNLLLHNPFGPQLPSDKFAVTLQQHRRRLQARPDLSSHADDRRAVTAGLT